MSLSSLFLLLCVPLLSSLSKIDKNIFYKKKTPQPVLSFTSEGSFELESNCITDLLQIPEWLPMGKTGPPLKDIGALHDPPLSAAANSLVQTHQTATGLCPAPGSSFCAFSTEAPASFSLRFKVLSPAPHVES